MRAGGAHRALKPDEAINQELLQAVLAGFLSLTSQGKKIRWTDKALAQFKHRVKELTGRSWGELDTPGYPIRRHLVQLVHEALGQVLWQL